MKRSIEPINDTTFEVTLLGDDKVEIGDKESTDFMPHLKLNRWGNECFIKLELATTEKPLPIVEGNSIKWDGGNQAIIFNPRPRDNGFEFDIILSEKPLISVFLFILESKNLEFLYQPPLSEVFSDGWNDIVQDYVKASSTEVRNSKGEIVTCCPENVVGSYAVYHTTKKNHILGQTDYGCGKAFHIYRPKLIDNDGSTTWADLIITKNTFVIDLSKIQDWLDNAAYPVTIDPDFGYTTEGQVEWNASANYIYTAGYTYTGVAGTGVSMSVYGKKNVEANVQMALYEADDDTVANGTTGSVLVNSSDLQWWTANFTSAPTITVQEYQLCWNSDGAWKIYYDLDGATDWKSDGFTFGSWPEPPDWSTYDTHVRFSIKCTYEAAGIPAQAFMYYQRLRRQG